MAEKRIDTSLLDKAISFALKAHSGFERRGKGFPYIVHPMEACAIVSTITSDQELLAAAMLHDVVEDTDYSENDIRKEFGDRIADLVASESDAVFENMSAEESWKSRKEIAIKKLKNSSHDAKIVAIGDKLSNARAILYDYNAIGDKIWDRFHIKDKKEHEWHYKGLLDALSELDGTEAYKEFKNIINELFK